MAPDSDGTTVEGRERRLGQRHVGLIVVCEHHENARGVAFGGRDPVDGVPAAIQHEVAGFEVEPLQPSSMPAAAKWTLTDDKSSAYG